MHPDCLVFVGLDCSFQLAIGLVDAPKHLVERRGVASVYAIRATAHPRHEADVK